MSKPENDVFYTDVLQRLTTARMLDEVTKNTLLYNHLRLAVAELASEDVFGDERYYLAFDESMIVAREAIADLTASVESVFDDLGLTLPKTTSEEKDA